MKKLLTILSLAFSFCNSFGQANIEDIVKKIDIGYSTRWDVEQFWGKGEYLESKKLYPYIEQDNEPGLVLQNGLLYKDKGVTFVCNDDGELISSIQFKKPFKFSLNQSDTIEIGKTLFGQAFQKIDTITFTTTGVSNYWEFNVGGMSFFISKRENDRNKPYDEVPNFKDNLDYYNKQPISIVTIDLYKYDLFEQKYEEQKEGELYYIRPYYSPQSEIHKNCIEYGWPDNIPKILTPFYGLLGGSKSKKIKQGYWKEYSPSHKLLFEGEFKDDIKVGLFRYYDKNGILEKTENYTSSPFNIYYLIIIVVIAIPIIILTRLKKKKNVI